MDPFELAAEIGTTVLVDTQDAANAGLPVSNALFISTSGSEAADGLVGLITVSDLLGTGSQHFFLSRESAQLLRSALGRILDEEKT